MLVKFNRPSVMGIGHQAPLGKDAKPGTPNTNPVIEHQLMPGHNEIEDSKWDVISQHPTVQALLDDGTIETNEKFDGAKFFKAPVAAVKKIIGETVDHGLLSKWREGEKRPQVVQHLDARLAEINPGVSKEELDKAIHPKDNDDRVQTKPANLNP